MNKTILLLFVIVMATATAEALPRIYDAGNPPPWYDPSLPPGAVKAIKYFYTWHEGFSGGFTVVNPPSVTEYYGSHGFTWDGLNAFYIKAYIPTSNEYALFDAVTRAVFNLTEVKSIGFSYKKIFREYISSWVGGITLLDAGIVLFLENGTVLNVFRSSSASSTGWNTFNATFPYPMNATLLLYVHVRWDGYFSNGTVEHILEIANLAFNNVTDCQVGRVQDMIYFVGGTGASSYLDEYIIPTAYANTLSYTTGQWLWLTGISPFNATLSYPSGTREQIYNLQNHVLVFSTIPYMVNITRKGNTEAVLFNMQGTNKISVDSAPSGKPPFSFIDAGTYADMLATLGNGSKLLFRNTRRLITWTDFSSLNASTSQGFSYISPVRLGEILPLQISFPLPYSVIVNAYGQDAVALEARSINNRIFSRNLIGLGRTVTLYMPPLEPVILYLIGKNTTIIIGQFTPTPSQLNLVVNVPVIIPEFKTKITAIRNIYYNKSGGFLRVEWQCASPPCNIYLRKGNETYTATCDTEYCRTTWYTSDPLISAEIWDANGTHIKASAGTSMQVPDYNPIKGLAKQISDALSLNEFTGGNSLAFLAVLASIIALIAFSVPGEWELGILAMGFTLFVSSIIFNIDIFISGIGLILSVAGLSLLLRGGEK